MGFHLPSVFEFRLKQCTSLPGLQSAGKGPLKLKSFEVVTHRLSSSELVRGSDGLWKKKKKPPHTHTQIARWAS